MYLAHTQSERDGVENLAHEGDGQAVHVIVVVPNSHEDDRNEAHQQPTDHE